MVCQLYRRVRVLTKRLQAYYTGIMKRRIFLFIAIVAVLGGVLLAFAACGKATITDVTIGTNPNKTTYYIGESVDLTGCTLDLTYSDGKVKTVEVDNSMVNDAAPSARGDYVVQIRYTEGGHTYTVPLTLKVIARSPKRIEIEQPLEKSQYVVGQTVSIKGLKLRVYYTDTDSRVIEEGAIVYTDTVVQEDTTFITVRYEGVSKQIPIRVVPLQNVSLTAGVVASAPLWQYNVLYGYNLAFYYIRNDDSRVDAGGDVTVAEMGTRMLAAGEMTLHLSKTEEGVTYEGEAVVTVLPSAVQSVAVSNATYAYRVGQAYQADMTMDVTFANGIWRNYAYTSGQIAGLSTSVADGATLAAAGKKEVLVMYNGKEVGRYFVGVDATIAVQLQATNPAGTVTVAAGETAWPSNLVLEAVFSDGSRTVIWNYGNKLSDKITLSAPVQKGDTVAYLYYEELAFSFAVNVVNV